MIALAADYLLFQLGTGESVPFSADMISVELTEGTTGFFDLDFVKQAARAVFHYFRHELKRQTVTMGEFSQAVERVLRGFAATVEKEQLAPVREPAALEESTGPVIQMDLSLIANESADGCELFFFPRLRDEVRGHLKKEPRVLHLHGLRRCVKRLIGAQRWSARCQDMQEQIVNFLRETAATEARDGQIALRVD
jgi:hypothetical protein